MPVKMTEEEKKSKEDKSRNPNPKTPTMMGSEKKTKKQIFEEKFGEYNDKPFAKLSKGGLKGNQKKLDKNNNNRIDSEDFKILRGGRAAMKAKKGKLVPLKSDPTKAISSVKPSTGGKGGPPKKTPKEAKSAEDFIKRRKKLMGLKSVIGKGGRIGAAAALLGLAGAGAASLGQKIGRKLDEVKKKNKKMGGGMMKRYNKGGGADTGKMGELRSKLGVAGDEFRRFQRSRPKLKAPDRKPMKPLKAMGGGMIGASQMPGYKTGTSVKARGCKLGRSKPTKMY